MTVHQCPKCELRFDWKTELDDHCWHDHPEFRHEYPAHAVPPEAVAPAPSAAPAEPATHERERHHADSTELVRWLVPPPRHERP